MKRIAISVLTIAISVAAAGSAFAGAQDYGNDPRYGHGYNDGRAQRTVHTDRALVLRVEQAGSPYGGSDGSYQREECWNEQTNAYDDGYYRDNSGRLYQGDRKNNVQGALLGALVGGALGNQVGKGDGKKAATIVGAVAGAAIGNNVGNNNRTQDHEYRDNNSGVVRRCRTIITNDNGYNNSGGYGGYNVTYRYAGQIYQAFTNQRPGRYIRVTVDVRPQDNNGYR